MRGRGVEGKCLRDPMAVRVNEPVCIELNNVAGGGFDLQ